MHNIQLKNLATYDRTDKISLDEAEKIIGSGAFTWAGAAGGAVLGGTGGAVSYPVGEAWDYVSTGDSDFNIADWGETVVKSGTAGAVAGSGLGKIIDNTLGGGMH